MHKIIVFLSIYLFHVSSFAGIFTLIANERTRYEMQKIWPFLILFEFSLFQTRKTKSFHDIEKKMGSKCEFVSIIILAMIYQMDICNLI